MKNRKKKIQDNFIRIYTDGACEVNPGIGGWAAVIYFKKTGPSGERIKKEISGSEEYTTNNKMEMTAALKALRIIKYPRTIG